MAIKEVYIGSVGPYLYDDEETYEDGVARRGIRVSQVYINDAPSSDNEIVRSTDIATTTLSNQSEPTVAEDTSEIYGSDQVAGNSCPHIKTENGKILKLYQQSHLADVDATALTAITNAYGTSDGVIEDIGDTSAADQSGAIKNNFKEATATIAELQTVVASLRTQLNAALVVLENLGFLATS